MVHVARELQRQHFTQPLLIGGATTSRRHTAVKIAPHYEGITLHVLDASRAPGVVGDLLDPERRQRLDRQRLLDQAHDREIYQRRRATPLLPWAQARLHGARLDWRPEDVAAPLQRGLILQQDLPLAELLPFIDWTPFFMTWELRGTWPQLLDHKDYGHVARELFGHAQDMLQDWINRRALRAHGAFALFPAHSDGDDLVLYADDDRRHERARLPMLRQQRAREDDDKPHLSLADFVAPRDTGLPDHVGAFIVTAGDGLDQIIAHHDAQRDDYSAILARALADRLAEAFAEKLHADARAAWGYGLSEDLSPQDLVQERYRGIRPAPGYPACPDHTLKTTLFDLLDATAHTGARLTESLAMTPAAAVCGLYFAHPQARYFTLGPIGKDQLTDYAHRKGQSVEDTERWLSPWLGYEPGN
jgi:5-methyltetrahydrofolate--homocysteine methyltransferase